MDGDDGPRTTATPAAPSRQRARLHAAVSYAGFGSGLEKTDALLEALGHLWSAPGALSGPFVDLGCGDGRVVIEVGKAFPARRALGVDIQAPLIERARALARQHGVGDVCDFQVADLAAVDLSAVSVVFLYFPPVAMTALLGVLSCSNLRNRSSSRRCS